MGQGAEHREPCSDESGVMDVSSAPKPILVIGPPRSGTTWVAQMLASASGVCYFHEPDNEKVRPIAFHLKQRLHRFPYLRVGQHVPEFEALWRLALYGSVPWRSVRKLVHRLGSLEPDVVEENIRRRCDARWTGVLDTVPSGLTRWQHLRTSAAYVAARGFQELGQRGKNKRRLVKSVHSVLALPWIARKFDVSVVIVRRHPFATAASYLRMGLPDADRNLFSQQEFVDDCLDPSVQDAALAAIHPLQRIGYQLAAMEWVFESYNDSGYVVVQHEALCQNPLEEFARVFRSLDLRWTPAVERAIGNSNREGEGFSTQRVRHREVGKWSHELDEAQLRILEDCFLTLNIPQRLFLR